MPTATGAGVILFAVRVHGPVVIVLNDLLLGSKSRQILRSAGETVD
jgi:hypothetical protein